MRRQAAPGTMKFLRRTLEALEPCIPRVRDPHATNCVGAAPVSTHPGTDFFALIVVRQVRVALTMCSSIWRRLLLFADRLGRVR